MALSEELLMNDYHTVLSGKWNQDPVEVANIFIDLFVIVVLPANNVVKFLQRLFGIAQSIDNTPTAHSWLHIFRILSLHNFTKTIIKNGNVDNEDELRVLVAYKKKA